MININLVGSVYDKKELTEIETIVKVFVVAERINDLTFNQKTENIVSNPPNKPKTKTKNNNNFYNTKLSLLNVRGFN